MARRYEAALPASTKIFLTRPEDAIARWRNLNAHRSAQAKGRSGVFDDYRLRIASVIRDYGMFDRAQAPTDSLEVHTK